MPARSNMFMSICADLFAGAVYRRYCEALNESLERGKLTALAYCEKSFEKWLVFETYWRLIRDWQQIDSSLVRGECAARGTLWGWHLEIGCPCGRTCKKKFDLGFGPTTRTKLGGFVATLDTIIFEAKL